MARKEKSLLEFVAKNIIGKKVRIGPFYFIVNKSFVFKKDQSLLLVPNLSNCHSSFDKVIINPFSGLYRLEKGNIKGIFQKGELTIID
ncbi:hypothetical protein L6261_01435 [Candidatus Parcubacteria bacterium]|nr:hypothetical protein [Candidatus Parcubacteria bacterium]